MSDAKPRKRDQFKLRQPAKKKTSLYSIGESPTNTPTMPTPAAAAEIDTAHTEGEQPQSLWGRAINSDRLSPQERKTLADTTCGVDSQETADAVGAIRLITQGILNKKEGKLWKIKFREEEVVLRDVGMKILRWVDTFKQIGDVIVQFDPVHAALPWAGFRLILQVDLNRCILDRTV